MDFEYLNGVAGEDDDFRERIRHAGWPPVHDPEIEGLHQDHSHETEPHRLRDTKAWADGLERNRRLLRQRWEKVGGFPFPANADDDWSAEDCVVGSMSYAVGSREPAQEPALRGPAH